MTDLKKKDIVYYARIVPNAGIYDLCELKIRTIEDSYFVVLQLQSALCIAS